MADLHAIERSNLYRTHRTYFFYQFCQLFYICPHTKMLDMPKWFSDCESVNSVVSINISGDYYSGAKNEKTKKKKNSVSFKMIWRRETNVIVHLGLFWLLIFRSHYKRNKYKLLEKRSCVSVWVCFAPNMPDVGSRYSIFGFEKKKKKKKNCYSRIPGFHLSECLRTYRNNAILSFYFINCQSEQFDFCPFNTNDHSYPYLNYL